MQKSRFQVKNNMNIGFDLDRIFINYPPFIPPKLIDWLYKRHDKKTLSYNIPRSRVSKLIRRLSHISPLRPPIKTNIHLLQNFPRNPHAHNLYLISSRYKFLESLTHRLLNRWGLTSHFCSINLNTKNEQPHHFKEKIIKKYNIKLYIDDDLALLKYLQRTCPKVKLLWYNPNSKSVFSSGITAITSLDQVKNFLA